LKYHTLTNKNSIQEEIKSRLKVGNACYYSVQNLFFFFFLSKKLKIKIFRTIILPVVLYGCETWSLTLREERRLRVFENRVLRRDIKYLTLLQLCKCNELTLQCTTVLGPCRGCTVAVFLYILPDPPWKISRCPLNRKLGGPQSCSGC
jgi:hypothetical protein